MDIPFILNQIRIQRFISVTLLLVVVAGVSSPLAAYARNTGVTATGEASNGTLVTHDGLSRTYRLFVPSSYDASTELPLLLVFHGGFGSGEQVSRQTGFDEIAEREGFIAVYPDGVTSESREVVPTWNAGDCCGYAMLSKVDDVAFVDELLDSMETEFSIDSSRIYATGMSNGGMLSYRLACELADRIAAVAPVAGSIALGECRPGRPIPLIIFHGTADESVPYEGGPLKRTGSMVPAAPDLAATWAAMNGCTSEPIVTEVDGYTETRYEGCVDDATVTLLSIDGFPHAWPGSDHGAIHSGADSPLDASEMIWSFFADQHL